MCFGGKEIRAAIGGILCESDSWSLIKFRVGLTALLRAYFSSAHVKTGPGWVYCVRAFDGSGDEHCAGELRAWAYHITHALFGDFMIEVSEV